VREKGRKERKEGGRKKEGWVGGSVCARAWEKKEKKREGGGERERKRGRGGGGGKEGE